MLFLPELLFTLAAGPLGISFHMDAASAEDYFLAVGHLEKFGTGFAIDNLDYFAATFWAFTGFAIYDNWFHAYFCFAKLIIFFRRSSNRCHSCWVQAS